MEISEINEKFSVLMQEVDRRLDHLRREEEKLQKLDEAKANENAVNVTPKVLCYEEAVQRNANLLKSLEMIKARLRSRSTYSPVESILQKALKNYQRSELHAPTPPPPPPPAPPLPPHCSGKATKRTAF